MSTDALHRRSRNRAFTLAEVLAALLFMAILIPVTMQGVSVASRAGTLGLRKAGAMRIAERILEEQMVINGVANGGGSGTYVEGDINYPWTMRIEPWIEDSAMSLVNMRVSFEVQGNTYDVSVNTLYDPNANQPATTTTSTTVAAQ